MNNPSNRLYCYRQDFVPPQQAAQTYNMYVPSPTYVDPEALKSAFSGDYYNKQWGSVVGKDEGKKKKKYWYTL